MTIHVLPLLWFLLRLGIQCFVTYVSFLFFFMPHFEPEFREMKTWVWLAGNITLGIALFAPYGTITDLLSAIHWSLH